MTSFWKTEKCVSIFELSYIKQKKILSYRLTCNRIIFKKSTRNFIKTHITKFPFFCPYYFCLYFVDGVIQGSIYQRELTLL